MGLNQLGLKSIEKFPIYIIKAQNKIDFKSLLREFLGNLFYTPWKIALFSTKTFSSFWGIPSSLGLHCDIHLVNIYTNFGGWEGNCLLIASKI